MSGSEQRSLIVVTGQEGAGKTTIMRGLLPYARDAAKVDAEDVGQVNPFVMDEAFLRLLWNNMQPCSGTSGPPGTRP